jgi:light-regulated signal transduction histidine kinase (bacteriophytochrome)
MKVCGGTIDPKAVEYLSFVRSGATRMETLVRGILAYSQLSKSKLLRKFAMPAWRCKRL